MKPIIGIFMQIDNDGKHMLMPQYITAVQGSGGFPILLPYTTSDEDVERYVSMCDGFIYTGGYDIDPKHYNEPRDEMCGEHEPYRDDIELRSFGPIFESGKPILGICRGEQLINVALGGTLYQDIPSQLGEKFPHRQAEPPLSPSHSVRVLPDTPLYELVGRDEIVANSFHHQSVKKLGEGLEVMAYAEDGIIEAFRHKSHPFLWAFQWHPERLYHIDGDAVKIFDKFISAAKCKKNKK